MSSTRHALEEKLPDDLAGTRLLSIRQAMELLHMGKTTFYGILGRSVNPIPSVKIGKSRRIPLDKLKWWMEKLGA